MRATVKPRRALYEYKITSTRLALVPLQDFFSRQGHSCVQVVPRPTPYGRFPVDSEPGDTGSDVYGQRSPREEPDFATNTCESDEPGPSPEHLNLYDNLAAELRAKLGSRDNQPILLPPKDYDTVHRSKGKLINLDDKKATNEKVVGDIGAGGIFAKGFQNSSGDDSARGDSENGSLRNSQNGEQQPGGGYTAMYGGVGAGGVPWPRIHVEEDPVDRGSTGSDRNRLSIKFSLESPIC